MVQAKKTIFGGEEGLLLRLKKHKDKQAFIQAYDLYIDQIYRFVYFKVRGKEAAEDITSLVFLKCWNYIYEGNLGDHKTLKPLLYKIARNTVIDHYRKTSHQTDLPLEVAETGDAAVKDPSNLHEKTADALDFQTIIEESLPKLKDEYREVIILRFINELSIAEIAAVLHKTPGNVRVLIHRALESLQKLLKPQE